MPNKKEQTILAHAKINLSLDIVGKRPDGYHLLSTVMQSIELHDRIRVQIIDRDRGIVFTTDQPELPIDESNTCYRAAKWFLEAAEVQTGLSIRLEKHIPMAAGMGGGSADAAGVLRALEALFPGRLSAGEIHDCALRVGADVPFCLTGGTALCEGIGEQVSPLTTMEDIPVLLVNPAFGVPTGWVYDHFDLETVGIRPDTVRVLNAISNRDLRALAGATANVLESVTLPAHPVLSEIKRALVESGALVEAMSGSGPTMFGLYEDMETCTKAADNIQSRLGSNMLTIVTRTVGPGR